MDDMPPEIEIKKSKQVKHHTCSVCDVYFSNEEQLKYHICSNDNKPGFQYVFVYIISIAFNTQLLVNMWNNIRRCDICDKVTTTFISLTQHKIRHTGERPFKCPNCPKMFKVQIDVRAHQKQIHFNRNQIICEVCGKI